MLLAGAFLFAGAFSTTDARALSDVPSAPTNTSAASSPISITAPSITGHASSGRVLSASQGTWIGDDLHYAYQWYRCEGDTENCTSIAGATGAERLLTDADIAKTFKVEVQASNAAGAATGTSARTNPVSLSQYGQAVVADGARNYWQLHQGSAPYKDAVGTTNLELGGGSSIVGITPSSGGVQLSNGRIGTASDFVVPQTYTIEYWFKGTVSASGPVMDPGPRLFQTSVGGGPGGTFGLINWAGGEVWLWGSTRVIDGQWHHVVAQSEYSASLGRTTMRLFVDGQLDGQSVRNGAPYSGTGKNFWLGSGWNSKSTGSYDDVAFYTSALSAERVAAHYGLGAQLEGHPESVSPPIIEGDTETGVLLVATPGEWQADPVAEYSYRWQRCWGEQAADCGDIPSATDSTYSPVGDDVGARLRVIVTAVNGIGSDSAASGMTAPVVATPPVNTSPPTLTGTAQAGKRLTVSSLGAWAPSGAYPWFDSWERCEADKTGCSLIEAAGESYRIADADVGKRLRLVAGAWNPDTYGQAQARSDWTDVVEPRPLDEPTNIVPPSIQGRDLVGRTLHAQGGHWAGTPAPELTYQWSRCAWGTDELECTDISNATYETYTQQVADVGLVLQVQVTATNEYGSDAERAQVEGPRNGPTTNAYADSVMEDLPAAYWQLEGANGNSDAGRDASGWNSYPATVSGAPTSAQGAYDDNKTLSFDGNDYLTAPYSGTGRSFTVEAWVNTEQADEQVALVNRDCTGTCSHLWQLRLQSGKPELLTHLSSGDRVISAPELVADGVWHHIAAVSSYDYGTNLTELALYVNGALAAQESYSGYINGGSASVALGRLSGAGLNLQGRLDEVALYSHALPSERISTHYAAGKAANTVTAPQNTNSPTTTGASKLHAELEGHAGDWTGADKEFRYRWLRCDTTGGDCTVIPWASSSTYRATAEDVDYTLRFAVTAINQGGKLTVTSLPTAVVEPRPNLYRDSVLHDGPLGYWRLDHANPGADTSGHGLDGVPGGALAAVSGMLRWETDMAMHTAAGHINIPLDLRARRRTSYTIEAWARTTDAQGPQVVASTETVTLLASPTDLQARLCSPLSCETVRAAATVAAGEWHHVALTVGEGRVALYLDGEALSDTAAPLAIPQLADRAFLVGASEYAPEETFDGTLDEVAVYPYRLSQARLQAHVDAARGVPDVIVDAAAAPAALTYPVIRGEVRQGAPLTVDDGRWAPAGQFTYQWRRCDTDEDCNDIAGASSPAYMPVQDDVGHHLMARITAARAGQHVTHDSAAVGPVQPAAPRSLQRPTLTVDSEAHTVAATQGDWDGTAPFTYAYEWERCEAESCDVITNADQSVYVADETADRGVTLQVRVTASNEAGSASVVSKAVEPSLPGPPVNVASPSINGEPKHGQLLRANIGRWTGSSPREYTTTWERCTAAGGCAPAGDDGALRLDEGYVGATLKLVVTAANAGGETVAETSTGPVAAAAPWNITAPTIVGVAREGQWFQAEPGRWDGTGAKTYAYRWQRCGADGGSCGDIPGATAERYWSTHDDVGHTLSVVVVGQNTVGNATSQSATTAPLAPDPILADHPALYWRFSETEGSTLADSSLDEPQTGTINGTPSALGHEGPARANRAPNTALRLGGGAFVDAPRPMPKSSAGTFEAWMRLDESNARPQMVLDQGCSNLANCSALRLWVGNGLVHADFDYNGYISTGNTKADWELPEDIDGRWVHIAWVIKPGGWSEAYLNGRSLGTIRTTYGASLRATAPRFRVGADYNGGNALQGDIDELAIYPAGLSQARIEAHYKAGAQRASLDATIANGPTGTAVVDHAAFTASSGNPTHRFDCRLDGGSVTSCADGDQTYTSLSSGNHRFEVRAATPGGVGSWTSRIWRVQNPEPDATDAVKELAASHLWTYAASSPIEDIIGQDDLTLHGAAASVPANNPNPDAPGELIITGPNLGNGSATSPTLGLGGTFSTWARFTEPPPSSGEYVLADAGNNNAILSYRDERLYYDYCVNGYISGWCSEVSFAVPRGEDGEIPFVTREAQVVLRRNLSWVTMYVNGLPLGPAQNTPQGASPKKPRALTLGAREGGQSGVFPGRFRHTAMYARELTDREVMQQYLRSSPGDGPKPSIDTGPQGLDWSGVPEATFSTSRAAKFFCRLDDGPETRCDDAIVNGEYTQQGRWQYQATEAAPTITPGRHRLWVRAESITETSSLTKASPDLDRSSHILMREWIARAPRDVRVSINEPSSLIFQMPNQPESAVGRITSYGGLPQSEVRLRWRFSDGVVVDAASASHAFNQPGAAIAWLEAVNGGGDVLAAAGVAIQVGDTIPETATYDWHPPDDAKLGSLNESRLVFTLPDGKVYPADYVAGPLLTLEDGSEYEVMPSTGERTCRVKYGLTPRLRRCGVNAELPVDALLTGGHRVKVRYPVGPGVPVPVQVVRDAFGEPTLRYTDVIDPRRQAIYNRRTFRWEQLTPGAIEATGDADWELSPRARATSSGVVYMEMLAAEHKQGFSMKPGGNKAPGAWKYSADVTSRMAVRVESSPTKVGSWLAEKVVEAGVLTAAQVLSGGSTTAATVHRLGTTLEEVVTLGTTLQAAGRYYKSITGMDSALEVDAVVDDVLSDAKGAILDGIDVSP